MCGIKLGHYQKRIQNSGFKGAKILAYAKDQETRSEVFHLPRLAFLFLPNQIRPEEEFLFPEDAL